MLFLKAFKLLPKRIRNGRLDCFKLACHIEQSRCDAQASGGGRNGTAGLAAQCPAARRPGAPWLGRAGDPGAEAAGRRPCDSVLLDSAPPQALGLLLI